MDPVKKQNIYNQNAPPAPSAPSKMLQRNPPQDHRQPMPLKIIKRYQNRKLYDTQRSRYVTLNDIANMVRTRKNVRVVDNKTKTDITASTLTQIIFEKERKMGVYAPLPILFKIIQTENGSMSSYLSKLITPSHLKQEAPVKEYVYDLMAEKGPVSYKNPPMQNKKNQTTPKNQKSKSHLDSHVDKVNPTLPNSLRSSF